MATYNDGVGYNLNSPGAGYPAHTNWREAIVEITLNIAEIVAARAAANLPALADGDTLEIISLPEQCAVLTAGLAVEEVSTGALTASVGDSGDAVQFIAASLTNADTSYSSITEAGTAAGLGNYYPAADVLTVTLAGVTPVDGIIRVWAKVVDGAGQVAVSTVPSATPPNP
jgi:hypothetical protein